MFFILLINNYHICITYFALFILSSHMRLVNPKHFVINANKLLVSHLSHPACILIPKSISLFQSPSRAQRLPISALTQSIASFAWPQCKASIKSSSGAIFISRSRRDQSIHRLPLSCNQKSRKTKPMDVKNRLIKTQRPLRPLRFDEALFTSPPDEELNFST